MEIIAKLQIGSHMFRLNNKNSDKDFLVIFDGDEASHEEHTKEDKRGKNTPNDTDTYFLNIEDFKRGLGNGEIRGVEILFIEDEFVLYKTSKFDELRKLPFSAHSFAKNTYKYIIKQSSKFNIKGTYFFELMRVKKILKTIPDYNL